LNEGAGQSLARFLVSKAMLLVIDNFEHVIEAGPALAGLLAAAPAVRAIVTSREPLHVAAERVFPVAPLRSDDAVALFVERATAAVPDFALNGHAATVERICSRLDGLPLAIELAAARIGLLSPDAILNRLDKRLTLLTGGARDQPARQRTLRNTLEWSHDLLTADERRAFAALGVFTGGFNLEAAERVCAVGLDAIASLVDKSLVRRDDDRFRLLDTVREFAAERLAVEVDADDLRDRHAAEYERLAEEAAYSEHHRRQEPMVGVLAADQDNLRAALDWLAETDRSRLLRMSGALGWFWHVHSDFAEGRSRLADALARAPSTAAPRDRARALSASVEVAAWQGDVVAGERFAVDAMAAWRTIGREQEIAFILHDLGWGHFFAGEDAVARERMDESLRIQSTLGDPMLINRAQLGLLQVLVALGELDAVKRLGPEALALSQELSDVWYEHFAHHFLADCALMEGDYPSARDGYRRSLAAAWRSGDRVETCYELQGMAMAAAGRGESTRALRLGSAADHALLELGVEHVVPFWRRLIDDHLTRAREALGSGDAMRAWEAGAVLPLGETVNDALTG
jgi:predicted ATPase